MGVEPTTDIVLQPDCGVKIKLSKDILVDKVGEKDKKEKKRRPQGKKEHPIFHIR